MLVGGVVSGVGRRSFRDLNIVHGKHTYSCWITLHIPMLPREEPVMNNS